MRQGRKKSKRIYWNAKVVEIDRGMKRKVKTDDHLYFRGGIYNSTSVCKCVL